MDDRAAVEAQIGRPSRAPVDVVRRCHLDLPVVLRMPPLLDDGTPFPTRYWLTCPLAVKRIDRMESAGGVRDMTDRVAADAEFGRRMESAHQRYAADRDASLPDDTEPKPVGGVGGVVGGGVKCLHAHYADTAAGFDNPVGEVTVKSIEPLDCLLPCVVAEGERAVSNPDWFEPK